MGKGIEITEAEVKKGVEDYLQYAVNQGKLWFARLNAGDIYIPNKDGSHRLFKGVKPGTADYIVIQGGEAQLVIQKEVHRTRPVAFVTFIECKSSTGKQRPDQIEFEQQITGFNCRYAIVRSVAELEEVLQSE